MGLTHKTRCRADTASVLVLLHHRMSEDLKNELAKEIQNADTSKLKECATIENPAGKHDMTMYGIEKFNKNNLKQTNTIEKNTLPAADDLKQVEEAEKTP